jgi:thiosulfate dehydrogenase
MRRYLWCLLWVIVGCRPAAEDTEAMVDTIRLPVPQQLVAYRVPDESEITDSTILASVRRGKALMQFTRDSLPRNVGNRLQCVSCHPDNGTRKNVMPWVGIYARFPQYRARPGGIQVIQDRINDCFKRSMNGTPPHPESRDMRDIIAYMAFLSSGYPVFANVEGQSIPPVPVLAGDTVRGASTYAAKCSVCHGTDGAGTDVFPAVWGPNSYNVGAGMARVRTAANFIKIAMPQTAPGTLTDQEAFDLATYINTRPRPDFAGKELDWPKGDPPPDVAYPVNSKKK